MGDDVGLVSSIVTSIVGGVDEGLRALLPNSIYLIFVGAKKILNYGENRCNIPSNLLKADTLYSPTSKTIESEREQLETIKGKREEVIATQKKGLHKIPSTTKVTIGEEHVRPFENVDLSKIDTKMREIHNKLKKHVEDKEKAHISKMSMTQRAFHTSMTLEQVNAEVQKLIKGEASETTAEVLQLVSDYTQMQDYKKYGTHAPLVSFIGPTQDVGLALNMTLHDDLFGFSKSLFKEALEITSESSKKYTMFKDRIGAIVKKVDDIHEVTRYGADFTNKLQKWIETRLQYELDGAVLMNLEDEEQRLSNLIQDVQGDALKINHDTVFDALNKAMKDISTEQAAYNEAIMDDLKKYGLLVKNPFKFGADADKYYSSTTSSERKFPSIKDVNGFLMTLTPSQTKRILYAGETFMKEILINSFYMAPFTAILYFLGKALSFTKKSGTRKVRRSSVTPTPRLANQSLTFIPYPQAQQLLQGYPQGYPQGYQQIKNVSDPRNRGLIQSRAHSNNAFSIMTNRTNRTRGTTMRQRAASPGRRRPGQLTNGRE
jgi:hypothetical protein